MRWIGSRGGSYSYLRNSSKPWLLYSAYTNTKSKSWTKPTCIDICPKPSSALRTFSPPGLSAARVETPFSCRSRPWSPPWLCPGSWADSRSRWQGGRVGEHWNWQARCEIARQPARLPAHPSAGSMIYYRRAGLASGRESNNTITIIITSIITTMCITVTIIERGSGRGGGREDWQEGDYNILYYDILYYTRIYYYTIIRFYYFTILYYMILAGGRARARARPRAWGAWRNTGFCDRNTPFVWASALQHSSRNSSPAPDLVFSKLIFPGVLFSGGVFFFRHLNGKYINNS